MKILFLDIDGVLNRYAFLGAPSTISLLEHELCQRLNKILMFTDARLVISSTWRYLIINGHYDILGFAHMLKTHGVTEAKVIGHTGEDSVNRGRQIRNYMRGNPALFDKYVILDDDDDGMSYHGANYIKIDGREGLQDRHVDKAIALLGSNSDEQKN